MSQVVPAYTGVLPGTCYLSLQELEALEWVSVHTHHFAIHFLCSQKRKSCQMCNIFFWIVYRSCLKLQNTVPFKNTMEIAWVLEQNTPSILHLLVLKSAQQITGPGWMHEISYPTWCSGRTWRERVGREVGEGSGMGKTCEPKAFSFQCMTKFTTYKKKKKKKKCSMYVSLFCNL